MPISYNKSMTGFVDDIEKLTLDNKNFRKVLYTGQHTQLVLMHLLPSESIGEEVHETTDQFLRIEAGEGVAELNGEKHELHDGSAIVVPAGTTHNVTNTSATNPLKLYTLYSPAHHKDGTVHPTKADAAADEADHL